MVQQFFFSVMKFDPVIDCMELVPNSKKQAQMNKSNNFPVGTTHTSALQKVSDCAVSGWRHCKGPLFIRCPWNNSSVMGPRAILVVVSNGPVFFEQVWKCVFLENLSGTFFEKLPECILRMIIGCAMKS